MSISGRCCGTCVYHTIIPGYENIRLGKCTWTDSVDLPVSVRNFYTDRMYDEEGAKCLAYRERKEE